MTAFGGNLLESGWAEHSGASVHETNSLHNSREGILVVFITQNRVHNLKQN